MAVKSSTGPGAGAEQGAAGRRLFLIDGPSLVYRAFFALPESIGPGLHELRIHIGSRAFPPITIEVI